MKKIILFGLMAGLAMLIINFVVSAILGYLFPMLNTEYNNTNLFRPWSDPLMWLMFLHPFAVGIILAWIWSKVKDVLSAEKNYEKGLVFGFIFWVISLPGMLISYATFQVSLTMILSWTLALLAEYLAAGFIFSKALK